MSLSSSPDVLYIRFLDSAVAENLSSSLLPAFHPSMRHKPDSVGSSLLRNCTSKDQCLFQHGRCQESRDTTMELRSRRSRMRRPHLLCLCLRVSATNYMSTMTGESVSSRPRETSRQRVRRCESMSPLSKTQLKLTSSSIFALQRYITCISCNNQD